MSGGKSESKQSGLWIVGGDFALDEIEAGIAVAYALLVVAGFTTDEAWDAMQALSNDEPHNGPAAIAWRDAEIGAIATAGKRRGKMPDSANLVLA